MSGPPRRFDWDEAKRLFAQGHGYAELARRFDVTPRAIRRAVDPEHLKRDLARSTAWTASGTCPDCGAPSTRINRTTSHRCNPCAAKAQAKVTEETAYCFNCKTWKPLEDFSPSHRRIGRGVHSECRACDTARRREWRQRNRERQRAYDRQRKLRVRAGTPEEGARTR